jgi:hypothetical protein
MSTLPENRDRVEALAAYGTPHPEIARLLRIDLDDLRKDYGEEFATGRTKTNSRVAEALYRTAIAGGREGVIAAIFWLKARAGWKETSVHELAAAEGSGPGKEIRIVFVEPDMTRIEALAVDGPGTTVGRSMNS